jgi:Flp pilus assembly protein TadG
LVLPIILILAMAIVDFARLYTTMLTVESAAREAADYGAYNWWHWQDADTANATKAEMERRACVASRNLPDYEGPDDDCVNPTVSTPDPEQQPGGPACDIKPGADEDPCRVTVSLDYEFHLFAPINLDFFGVRFGLPNTLTFTRDSTFTISSYGLREP